MGSGLVNRKRTVSFVAALPGKSRPVIGPLLPATATEVA